MRAHELIEKFNNEFGIDKPWPKQYKIDAETYGYVCQLVIEARAPYAINERVNISIGPNNEIMLKNVEIILEDK